MAQTETVEANTASQTIKYNWQRQIKALNTNETALEKSN